MRDGIRRHNARAGPGAWRLPRIGPLSSLDALTSCHRYVPDPPPDLPSATGARSGWVPAAGKESDLRRAP